MAVGTLILMIATGPRLAIVWDEGHVLGRENRIRLWFRALADPPRFASSWRPPAPIEELVPDPNVRPPRADEIDSRSKLLSARALRWFWPFAREEPHGHPPFYAIVGMAGDILAPSWAELPRARLGPMIVFSLTAGALYGSFSRRRGPWPAMAASGAWVFQPNLFALGHYAGYDAILASLWVGAILAFARAAEPEGKGPRWPWMILFGVLCGWAADTKLTGWFLPVPFLIWTAVARSRRGTVALIVGGMVATVTLYTFNPAWWADPIAGLVRFFHSNLSRAETIPIPVLFLGRVYKTPAESLPWYNTLVWTGMVTPVGFLVLAMASLGRWWKSTQSLASGGRVGTARLETSSSDPLPLLCLLNWAFLLLLRALPHTPGHDGVRQFLPAFGCLAMMAGVGAAWVVARFGRWGKMLVGAALVEGMASVALIMPVPLSYFSPIVGGLPGATRLGMEPTYFWDALSADALDRLDGATPRGRTVAFATFPMSWIYLRSTGAIRFGLSPIDRGRPAWYVVQNRPGAFRPADRELVRRFGSRHVLVEKFGVPLIWAFPFEEFEKAMSEFPPARGSR